MPEWKDISTAPKDGSRILAWIDDSFAEIADIVYWQPPQSYTEFEAHPTVENAFVKVSKVYDGYWCGTLVSPVTLIAWAPFPTPPIPTGKENGG